MSFWKIVNYFYPQKDCICETCNAYQKDLIIIEYPSYTRRMCDVCYRKIMRILNHNIN